MATTYEPIATTTLGSTSTTITFSSITATYTDLRLVLVSSDGVGSSITMRFNSDTGSNYSRVNLNGTGTSASTSATANATSINIAPNNAVAGLFGLYTVDIFSYTGSTNKTVLATNSVDQNGSGQVGRSVSLWRDTSAITTITLTDSSSFAIGTTATLYGILKA